MYGEFRVGVSQTDRGREGCVGNMKVLLGSY